MTNELLSPILNQTINITVGPTPIGVEFNDTSYIGRAFILPNLDFQWVSLQWITQHGCEFTLPDLIQSGSNTGWALNCSHLCLTQPEVFDTTIRKCIVLSTVEGKFD